jgi:dephospho-CoA kinase
MLIAGVTGGIGSGKSTVCRIFSQLGVPVFNADEEGRRLISSERQVLNKIKKLFGNTIIVSGEINRKKIASIVFKDKEKLAKLNAIIHPAVRKNFKAWVKEQRTNWVIEEAAILVETGFAKELDTLIVVVAPDELRIKRVVERDGVTRQDVSIRISNQMPQTSIMKQANYIIVNDDKQLVIPQVLNIFKDLNKKK